MRKLAQIPCKEETDWILTTWMRNQMRLFHEGPAVGRWINGYGAPSIDMFRKVWKRLTDCYGQKIDRQGNTTVATVIVPVDEDTTYLFRVTRQTGGFAPLTPVYEGATTCITTEVKRVSRAMRKLGSAPFPQALCLPLSQVTGVDPRKLSTIITDYIQFRAEALVEDGVGAYGDLTCEVTGSMNSIYDLEYPDEMDVMEVYEKPIHGRLYGLVEEILVEAKRHGVNLDRNKGDLINWFKNPIVLKTFAKYLQDALTPAARKLRAWRKLFEGDARSEFLRHADPAKWPPLIVSGVRDVICQVIPTSRSVKIIIKGTVDVALKGFPEPEDPDYDY